MGEPSHLTLYRFDAGAVFEGGLLGALERAQVGRGAEITDVVFIAREPDDGTIAAVDLAVGLAGGTLEHLLDFRLDARRRRELTRRTLAEHPGGLPGELIERIGAALAPGAAVLAVLHADPLPEALATAAARADGHRLLHEPTTAGSLAEVAPRLRALLAPEA